MKVTNQSITLPITVKNDRVGVYFVDEASYIKLMRDTFSLMGEGDTTWFPATLTGILSIDRLHSIAAHVHKAILLCEVDPEMGWLLMVACDFDKRGTDDTQTIG